MAIGAYTKACTKNVSGNSALLITEAANIDSVTVTSGEVSIISMVSGKTFKQVQGDIDSIIRTEEGAGSQRLIAYTHRVETVFSKPSTDLNTLRNSIADASACGIVAICLDGNGTCWLVGYNETDILKRPLYLSQDNMTSGTSLTDEAGQSVTVAMECVSGYESLPLNSTLADSIKASLAISGGSAIEWGSADTYPTILVDGNTEAWFDMAEGYMTKNVSEQISQWADRSGNSRHLLQAGADTIKPVWSSDGVLFDGVDDFMKCAAFTLAQPEMIYIVFRQKTWTNNDGVFDGNSDYSMHLRQTGTTPDIYISAGTPSSVSSDLVLDTFGIVRALFNGASSKFIVDANTPITGDFGSTDGGGFTLATRSSGGLFWSNIEVKEVIIRSIADTAPNEQIIYDYLEAKYSL